MNIKLFALVIVILLFVSGCTSEAPKAVQPNLEGVKYKAGQVWTYHTRPGEENSHVLILKVEKIGTSPNTLTVVHVRITNVSMKAGDGKIVDVIPHMPFGIKAIDQSVIELVESDAPIPDFQANYEYWRNEFDQGNAGAFDITVAEAVETVASTISKVP